MKSKVDVPTADSLLKAARLIKSGASRRTISVLHGRAIADALDYNNLKPSKRGVKTWLNRPEGRIVANLIFEVAINYFDFDPLQSDKSLKEMDFNKFITLLNMTGYDCYDINVNKIVEVLSEVMTIDYLDTCIKCSRPFLIPENNDTFCPRCRSISNKSAISRYGNSILL